MHPLATISHHSSTRAFRRRAHCRHTPARCAPMYLFAMHRGLYTRDAGSCRRRWLSSWRARARLPTAPSPPPPPLRRTRRRRRPPRPPQPRPKTRCMPYSCVNGHGGHDAAVWPMRHRAWRHVASGYCGTRAVVPERLEPCPSGVHSMDNSKLADVCSVVLGWGLDLEL